MNNTQNLIYQDQRLMILKSLIECGFDANEDILLECLALYGHRISQTRLRNHLTFLADAELVRINKIADGRMWIAIITRQGEDVAKGIAIAEGVRKPRPE